MSISKPETKPHLIIAARQVFGSEHLQLSRPAFFSRGTSIERVSVSGAGARAVVALSLVRMRGLGVAWGLFVWACMVQCVL